MSIFPVQDSFSRGEISPRLHARASLDLYRTGLSLCENFITLPHGGIRKRGGTYFVSEVIDSAKIHRVIPFVFSDDQAYCLLIGHLKLWVFAYSARVGTVEVTTPWSDTELAALQFVGSKDQMWITHPSYPTRILTRTAHTTWALSTFNPNDGPYDAVNVDQTKQMYPSAATGNITITSDFSAFSSNPTDIGRLVRIELESYRTIPPWEPDQLVLVDAVNGPAGELRRYNGNVYVCATPSHAADSINQYRTGATPPTHTAGTEMDGPGTAETDGPNVFRGLDWTFLHPGFGVARITAVTNTTTVSATVLSRFPAELVGSGNKSFVWRLGALHTGDYAGAVTIAEERLDIGVGTSHYSSKSFRFDEYRPGSQENDALQFLIVGDDIAWLAEVDGTRAIGTISGVKALSGSGLDEALTPSSFKLRKSRTLPCAPRMPIDTGTSVIYIEKSRKKLAEMTANQIGRFVTEDLMQISEHIPKRGLSQVAFQYNPDPILWFPLDTGELGGFTYQPSQEIRGAHRQVLGGEFDDDHPWGVVESSCVTPGQNGIDDVWLVVKRTINGETVRYLETMQPAFEYGVLEDAFQVDCGLTYEGVAVGTFTAPHLGNCIVDILANGVVYKGLQADGDGTAVLPDVGLATKAHMGLPLTSRADSLELDVGGKDGSIRGRRKRIVAVHLSLFETDLTGLEISSVIKGRWEKAKLPSIVVGVNSTASLYTGNVRIPIDDSWDGQGRFSIRHSNPTPCTVRAVTPEFDSEP